MAVNNRFPNNSYQDDRMLGLNQTTIVVLLQISQKYSILTGVCFNPITTVTMYTAYFFR